MTANPPGKKGDMNMTSKTELLNFLALPAILLPLCGCPADEKDKDAAEIQYVQVERLRRPGLNQALLTTNDFLNAFNAIPPSADLSADAAPVLQEAIATLNAIDSLDGEDDVDPTAIAGGFIPDVMRIDTTLAISTTAGSFTAGYPGILVG